MGLEGGAYSSISRPLLGRRAATPSMGDADTAWREGRGQCREEKPAPHQPLSHGQREKAPGQKGDGGWRQGPNDGP